jgi:hypothetical protein
MTVIPVQVTAQSIVQHPSLRQCICNPSQECIEADKICWDNGVDVFVHVRFDGCLCRDLQIKRCDCVIFRFESGRRKPTMFVIETKERNPQLSEVQEKIQCCIDQMIAVLVHPRSFRIVPVLCASAFRGLGHRAFLSYRVTIFGEKTIIRKRLHFESINDL